MGKIVATYTVKVTLRERDDHAQTDWGRRGLAVPAPTNEDLAELVERAIYDNVDYYGDSEINATSERTDR